MPKSKSRPLSAPTRFVADSVPESKPANKPMRRFAFTCFDEAPPRFLPEAMHYMCYQQEKAPSTGAKHWQGYVHLKNPMRFTQVKKLVGTQVHLEACRGSPEQNRAYCSKEESRAEGAVFTEHGTFVSQGERTDMETIYAALKADRPIVDIIDENPASLRYIGLMKQYQALKPNISVYMKRTIHVIYGPGGVGKTRLAHHMAGGSICRVPQFNKAGVWFDGCYGQDKLLVDDFDPSNAPPIDTFKQLMDSYEVAAPVKGGFVKITAKVIYITTNHHPDTWYPHLNFDKYSNPLEGKALEESRYPLMRRLKIRDCVQTPITELDFYVEYGKSEEVEIDSPAQSLNMDEIIDLTQ